MCRTLFVSVLAAISVAGIVGCTPEARQDYDAAGDKIGQGVNKAGEAAQTDAQKTGQAAGEAVDEAGDAAKDAAIRAAETAKNAGEAVKDTAQEAGDKVADAADNAKTTLAVKNAILSADNLDASNLNVDTVDNVVHLTGSVKSASDKKRAETIAKTIVAKGVTVKNELKVGND